MPRPAPSSGTGATAAPSARSMPRSRRRCATTGSTVASFAASAAVRAVDRADRRRARRTRCSRPFWRACRSMPTPRAPLPEPREIPGPRSAPRERRPRRLGPAADAIRTGRAACARRGSRASRRRGAACGSSSPTTSPTTTARATSRPRARPRGCRRGCAGASSARTRCGTRRSSPGGRRGGSSPSSDGASSRAHVLYHHPDLATKNLRPRVRRVPVAAPARRRSCGRGSRGAPASRSWMPACASSGTPAYMHNRVRMVTASFLIKNLLIDWRRGEQWFWDTLVDADGASNPFNWQWVAGSGADAAPVLPRLQPRAAGEEVRPARRVHRAVGARVPRRLGRRRPSRSSTSARRRRLRWTPTSRSSARRARRAVAEPRASTDPGADPRCRMRARPILVVTRSTGTP